MRQDRFLTGIIGGIVILVIIALGVFFTRQGTTLEYQIDDQPKGVIFNYILALHNGDYEKAYGYISEIPGKPTMVQFRQGIAVNSAQYQNNAVDVTDEIIDGQTATVTVVTNMSGGGIFNEGYQNRENAALENVDGTWKIISMPYSYWSYDWNQPYIK